MKGLKTCGEAEGKHHSPSASILESCGAVKIKTKSNKKNVYAQKKVSEELRKKKKKSKKKQFQKEKKKSKSISKITNICIYLSIWKEELESVQTVADLFENKSKEGI
jgi:cobalamin biosynthesis protein CobD/CbiB